MRRTGRIAKELWGKGWEEERTNNVGMAMVLRSYFPLSSFSLSHYLSTLWILLQLVLAHNVKSCSAFHSGFRTTSSLGFTRSTATITTPGTKFTAGISNIGGYSSFSSRNFMFDQLSSAITEAVKTTFGGRNRYK